MRRCCTAGFLHYKTNCYSCCFNTSGKGGAKRHRKVLRDNIQGITVSHLRVGHSYGAHNADLRLACRCRSRPSAALRDEAA